MQHDETPHLLTLLIESDAERSQSLSSQLEAAGYEVLSACQLDEVSEQIEAELPDLLVISSDFLAGETQIEAQALLEKHSELSILVILEEAHKPQAMNAVDEWLRRPFVEAELSERLGFARETSSRKLELRNAQLDLETLQGLGHMGSWKLRVDTGEFWCTEAASTLLGISFDGNPKSPDALLADASGASADDVRAWLESLFVGQYEPRIEYEVEHADGTLRRLRLRAGQTNSDAQGAFIGGIIQDCTPGLDPSEAASLVNTLDPLTGLPNRKQFLQSLDSAINEAFDTQEQIAILFIEVDSLADGASELSQEQREAMLVQVVQQLSADLRDLDILSQAGADLGGLGLSRVGNETLTILLREQTRSQDAYKVARRIRQHSEETFVVNGCDVKVNFNIGIAVYPGDAESALGLIKCAEEAMYCAKQHGRNNIQFYTSSMNTATFESLTLEASLRRAIDNNELRVYYQPKVDLASNRIIGMEALVRWMHPELGMVSPAQFIPIAEETGLIIPIGEFVLRTACEQNKAWQEMGLDPIRMAVNLSSVQFRRPDLFDNVIDVLEGAKLDPEWLELEITESILLRNVEATISTLQRLKRAGIHLSIDDFGTGYSSLSYLKRFPVDTLKIDQSFIREVTSNADDASITTSIILMGHSLKLKVIAEGVETKSQLAFLRVLECDEVQGYFFSPPVPGPDATKLIEDSLAKGIA